jgi:hypothetical protein
VDFNHPVFVRYGGLSSVPQDGYDLTAEGFHKPPARRGIYAFVNGFVQPFLIGTTTLDPRRQEYVRNIKGEIMTTDHPDYDRYYSPKLNFTLLKNDKHALVRHKKPVYFKYDGPIWSHLEERMKPNEIEQRSRWWVLSDMPAYIRALKKEVGIYKRQRARTGMGYDIDHMEVFIEKV